MLWALLLALSARAANAVTTVLFDSSQTIALVSAGTTSDTFRTGGYLFEVTRDKLFTGGVGMTEPIGRYIRVPWPQGLEAQAVTTGPHLSKATVTIRRVDGKTFALPAFTVKLLANTWGAGAALEIMPILNGEDGLPDPLMFDVSGSYGMSYIFTSSQLAGFDTYKATLYVDYAFTALTLVDATPVPPPPPPHLDLIHLGGSTIRLSWPTGAQTCWLDVSTDLRAAGWVQSATPPVPAGGFNVVDLELSGPCLFFRLSD